MNFEDVIILLARQRSGTNAVRSVLESHPDVFCFVEPFWLPNKDARFRPARGPNFFTFVKEYARGDVSRLYPDRHERLFTDFLQYVRCFTDRRWLVLDVKYNTTHLFTKPWADNLTSPLMLDMITHHQLRVLNIRRANHLRYVISELKAADSGTYHPLPEGFHRDQSVHIDVARMLDWFTTCRAEDELIEQHFWSYPHFRSFEYVDLFTPPAGEIAPDFLDAVARWLRIPLTFSTLPNFRKQSYLPLAETIENYDEVVAAVTGTAYEHFLEDEPGYSRQKGDASLWMVSRR